MAQHNETDSFRIVRDTTLEERVLLLMVQIRGDIWWTAGSAVLIANGVALSATHIVDGFYRRNRDRIEAALAHMPLEEGDVVQLRNISFDAFQITGNGQIVLRWSVVRWRSFIEGSDVCILELRPHPLCPEAGAYEIDHTQMIIHPFPPAIGRTVFTCGWPDDPAIGPGPLPAPELTNFFPYISTGLCTSITQRVSEGPRDNNFPFVFHTSCETYSGMSGGGVFLRSANGTFALCGIHWMADPENRDSTTASTLWSALTRRITFHDDHEGMLLDEVARSGVNIPSTRFFRYEEPDNERPVLLFQVGELIQHGTIEGASDFHWLSLRADPEQDQEHRQTPFEMISVRPMNALDTVVCAAMEMEFPERLRWGADRFGEVINNPDYRAFVATGIHNSWLGYIVIENTPECSTHIHNLAKVGRVRRVGRTLLEHVLVPDRLFTLTVEENNAVARRLYEDCGFEKEVVRKGTVHLFRPIVAE